MAKDFMDMKVAELKDELAHSTPKSYFSWRPTWERDGGLIFGARRGQAPASFRRAASGMMTDSLARYLINSKSAPCPRTSPCAHPSCNHLPAACWLMHEVPRERSAHELRMSTC